MDRRLGLVVALIATIAAWPLSSRAATETIDMTILRDGDPIGRHRVTIEENGARRTVNYHMSISVKIAFITAFRFVHHRTEEWVDGRLVSAEGHTDNDGDPLDIKVEATARGYERTVNGRVERFGADYQPLSFWSRDMLVPYRHFFSLILRERYDQEFTARGIEPVTLGTRTVQAERFDMRGNLDHDLWFSPAGRLLRMTFERQGSDIEYLVKAEP